MKIEAETAKLAGLQIDLLSKIRSGKITLNELESFLNQPKTEKTEPRRFRLLKDLGIVEWRPEYDLDRFKKDRESEFHYYNEDFTNANFPNPSRVPKPGDKFRVQLHEQVVDGTTSSEERLAYLKSQPGAILFGANGLPMLYDQKRTDLPKGKAYLSFDEKEKLPFLGGFHGVPCLFAFYDGDFDLSLCNLESGWDQNDVLVSFSDSESSES
jgi:hypothetical protein